MDNTLSAQVHPTQPTPSSSSLSTYPVVPLHHHIPCNCPPPSFAAHLSRPGPYLNILESRRGTPFLTYLLHILRYSFATNRPHCQHLIFFFLFPIHHPCCCHCTTYRSRQVFSPLSPISTCYLLPTPTGYQLSLEFRKLSSSLSRRRALRGRLQCHHCTRALHCPE